MSQTFGIVSISCVEEGFDDSMPVDGKMEFLRGCGSNTYVSSRECFKTVKDKKLYDCEVYVEKPGVR